MKRAPLGLDEVRQSGYTHRATIDYTDFAGVAATTKTFDLIAGLGVGFVVKEAAYWLEVPFDGGATSALSLDSGYDLAAGADDPDAFLDAYELHADASEVFAGLGNGAAFATLLTGYAFQESAKLTALFTATGGNLSLLTQGKVHIFYKVVDLKKHKGD